MTTNNTTSKIGTAVLRIVAGMTGAAIIGCVTYATVKAVGGIEAPTAPLLIALAGGLVVGSMACGLAWSSGRKALAVAMAITLLTGEAYVLLNTGERELEAREAKQAPVRAAMVTREKLSREAETPVIVTTDRLTAAQKALDEVNTDARVKIATASCVKLCKQELTEQRTAAMQEVEAARAELYAMRKASAEKTEATNAALAAIPAVAAASPLAARINVPDWVLDLIRAGLFSVSANGLGAFLLAFSSHSGRRVSVQSVDSVQTVSEPKALSFEGPYSDDEIEQIKKALNGLDKPVTNDQLAALLNCSKSESSKRWRRAAEAGVVEAQRAGRYVHLRLVA
jgi:hypothetical protein